MSPAGRSHGVLAAGFLLAFLSQTADAAPKAFTLLFTGDNAGEIAPCG